MLVVVKKLDARKWLIFFFLENMFVDDNYKKINKKKHPIKFHLAFWCVTIARLSENLYRIRFGSMIVRTRSSSFVCLLSPAQGLVHHPIPCIHLKIPNFFNAVIIIIKLKVLTLEKKLQRRKTRTGHGKVAPRPSSCVLSCSEWKHMSGKVQALLEFHQAHEIEISDDCWFSRQENLQCCRNPIFIILNYWVSVLFTRERDLWNQFSWDLDIWIWDIVILFSLKHSY